MKLMGKGMIIEIFISIIFIFLFSIGFLIFFAPISNKILNVGNIAGMAVCGICDLLTIFHRPAFFALKKLWQYKLFRIISVVLLVIMVLLIVLASIFSYKMVQASNNKPDRTTTVIVLGCKVNGYAPTSMLTTRTLSCVEYLKEYPKANVIVSGGQGPGELISEAECMKRILVDSGIDSDRIYVENKSTSTKENIEFSYDIIKENNLCTDVTICTSEFHHYRTSLICNKIGINNAYAFNSYTLKILLPTYWVREWFGICYELLF